MPERILEAAEPINAVIDTTTLIGGGAATIGWMATFAKFFGEYYPYLTAGLATTLMIMTIFHVYRRIKNSKLDYRIKMQTIEMNKQELRRRASDQHNPIED